MGGSLFCATKHQDQMTKKRERERSGGEEREEREYRETNQEDERGKK